MTFHHCDTSTTSHHCSPAYHHYDCPASQPDFTAITISAAASSSSAATSEFDTRRQPLPSASEAYAATGDDDRFSSSDLITIGVLTLIGLGLIVAFAWFLVHGGKF